jgi:hypothetical protein
MGNQLTGPEMVADWNSAVNAKGINDSLATMGIGAAGGIGLASLIGLYKRLQGRPKKPLAAPVIAVSSDKMAHQKRADGPAAPEAIQGDPSWVLPAKITGGLGGFVGGFFMLRNYLERKKSEELERQKSRAEGEFTTALNTATAPEGLRIKAASAQGQLDDVEACMDFIDKMANAAFPAGQVEKQAISAWDVASAAGGLIPWWIWAPMLGIPAALGATAGWHMSEGQNPARSELANIKKRQSLAAINAPMPITAMLERRKKRPQSPEGPDPRPGPETDPGLSAYADTPNAISVE